MSATAHTVWVYPYFMESQVTSRDLIVDLTVDLMLPGDQL